MTGTETFKLAMPPAARRTPGNRRSLRQSIRDSLVMAYRSVLKMRRTPEQFFDVTLQPIVFTLMFTYLFGGAISGNVLSYLPVIIPGILVQTVLTTSSSTGVQLREDMDKGVFNRFRTLPIARIAPLAGALLADTVRFAIAAVLTLIMGYIMGYRPNLGGIVAGGLLVMFSA
ncbi:ABC-2 type transporter [Paraburkholderia susongensis]|uniref:ABC-2 type transporter n=1 Tax=Paraburkholderia susongensis TaxID=1515439 RepID=A0A1X7LWQ5_9BURK|nr:ABC-2 type transporter [Paraburkholderia susongensis]